MKLVIPYAILLTIIGCSGTSKEEVIAVYESEVKELERLNAASACVTLAANMEISEWNNAIEEHRIQIQEYQEAISHSLTNRENALLFQSESERLAKQCVEYKAQIRTIKIRTGLQIKKIDARIATQQEHVQKAREAKDLALGH